jgi:hypothetical protein
VKLTLIQNKEECPEFYLIRRPDGILESKPLEDMWPFYQKKVKKYEFLNNMNILLTGGTGFIGRNLFKGLKINTKSLPPPQQESVAIPLLSENILLKIKSSSYPYGG